MLRPLVNLVDLPDLQVAIHAQHLALLLLCDLTLAELRFALVGKQLLQRFDLGLIHDLELGHRELLPAGGQRGECVLAPPSQQQQR